MLKFVNSIREYNISYGMDYLVSILPVSKYIFPKLPLRVK